jgi:hypothetical protein
MVLADVAGASRQELAGRPPLDGDADRALARLRDSLWDALDSEPSGTAKASLGRELRLVLGAIEDRRAATAALMPSAPSIVDHLVARREARRAGLPMPPCPPGLNCNHESAGGAS